MTTASCGSSVVGYSDRGDTAVNPEVLTKQRELLNRFRLMSVEDKVAKLIFCTRPGPEEIQRAEQKDQLLVLGVKISRERYLRSSKSKRNQMVTRRCDSELSEIGYPDGHLRVLVLVDATANEMEFRESVYQLLGA